ncbi:MAG: manganese catalase family protein [Clostridia bacterium]|nr:manganese catalase family protein [Clostridia bacterium]
MWIYEKKLEYPVKIKNPNPKLAKAIITQLGGPDGELGASLRYLNQRYSMPYDEVIGILTDVGTEELAHMEIIAAIVHQLTRNLSIDEIKKSGFDAYFVDHTAGIYPVSAAGVPFTTSYLEVKGDVFADLNEDLAADATPTKEQPQFQKLRKPV